MAKVTAPLLSFGASGTVAGVQTYSKWRGRPYVRRRVIPSNPKTVEQTKTRGVFAVGNAFWKLAPTLAIAPWNLFATGQVLTGRNAFVGRYVRNVRGQSDQEIMEFSPGAKGGLIPVSVSPVGASLSIDVTIVPPDPPPGWTLTSAVAACIRNEDPLAQDDFTWAADEDDTDPYVISLTGLEEAVEYHVGGWLKWAKPDGSVAYGPSLQAQATPTA